MILPSHSCTVEPTVEAGRASVRSAVMREEREGTMRRRDIVIACAGFLLFLSGYLAKARGKVSFVEGALILVIYFALVAVIAYVVERVRNPGAR